MVISLLKSMKHRVRSTALLVATIAATVVVAPHQAAAQATNDLLMNTYASLDFSGAPLTTGPITTIDQTNLNPMGRNDNFSVRIEGYILAETTGTYEFETLSDDGVRLFVNSTTVINNYTDHAPATNYGSISLVAGTWVPILIEHYERRGGQRLRLRWQTPSSGSFVAPPASVLSQTLPIVSQGPLTREGIVASVIVEEATRALRADIVSNQDANQSARARHAAAVRCTSLREEDPSAHQIECVDGSVARASTPLTFDGSLQATDKQASAVGKFFSQTSSGNDESATLFFGDFDITRFEGGDVSAVLTARIARERMIADDVLLGFFFSTTATHSDLTATVDGQRTGYGLSAGAYVVDRLSDTLTWDGYLSVGAGRNNLDVNEGGDDISSDYNTKSVLMGFALSGSKEYETFEVRPELNLSVGYTDIGDVALDSLIPSVANVGSVTLGRISFEPDFVFPLVASARSFDESTLIITPNVACEYLDSVSSDTDCGGGLSIEWNASSADDRNFFTVQVSRDVLAGETRDSIGMQLESHF